MKPSISNPLVISAFGFTIIPKWHYENFKSANEIKRDRITVLTDANEELRDRLKTTTEGKKLAETRLLDANERVESLGQQNESFESTRICDVAQINSLIIRAEKLALADRTAGEVIESLNVQLLDYGTRLKSAQKELDTIKETYRKTLAANSKLDSKLAEAISNLSATELQCNEQTVKIATLQTSRSALLTDFDNNKRAVNIELDNHRIRILSALDNLERSLRNPSVDS